jgi:hypothetical protein
MDSPRPDARKIDMARLRGLRYLLDLFTDEGELRAQLRKLRGHPDNGPSITRPTRPEEAADLPSRLPARCRARSNHTADHHL